jgi:hypothetical protein
MNLEVVIASSALGVIVLMIVIELLVQRGRRKNPRRATTHRYSRRQPLLEDRMRDALAAPHAQYGEIFTSFTIWKKENETRMEIVAGAPWRKLNDFTRALVVRHVWRALEKLAKGSVVIVDDPEQSWSAEIDLGFDDQGIDPWGDDEPAPVRSSGGPQFIKGS